MNGTLPKCPDTWQRLLEAFSGLDRLRVDLFAPCGQKGVADLIEQALTNRLYWRVALELQPYLDVEYQQTLFPKFLAACGYRKFRPI